MSPIRIGVKDYEVVFTYNLYYSGWNEDTTGYIVKDSGSLKHVHTNYGTPYFADESTLLEFLSIYEGAIKDTKKALDMVRLSKS